MNDLQTIGPEGEEKGGTVTEDMRELGVNVFEREEERIVEGSENIKQLEVSDPEKMEEEGILKVIENMKELQVTVSEKEDEETVRGINLPKKEKEETIEEEEKSREEELERDILLQFINDAEVRISGKMSLRHKNQTTQKPDEAALAKHDSSLKKNTAFVRKLRNFTAQQLHPLMKDMANLNLSKYISEVAAALVDVKLKLTDVPAAVQLCSELHCTYQEFSKVLLDLWVKVLTLKKDDKISNPSKLRVDLRFYGDLITTGIFPQKDALPLLGNVLTILTTMDKEEHNNISIILSFCRHCGEDYAGLIPRTIHQLSKKFDMPIPRSSALLPEKQKNVRALLKDYYSSLCKHIRKVYMEVQAFERQNRRILQTKGELSNDRKEKGEILGSSLMRLTTSANNFAEILDEDLPCIPDDKPNRGPDQVIISESEGAAALLSVWEDDETQRFYQEFPNIKEFLPHIRFPKETVAHSSMPEEKLDEELKEDELEDDGRRDYDMHTHDFEDADDPENTTNISSKIMLDAFLSHLPNCVNREMIDNAAVEFLMNHNTKHHRRKLVKVLFGVPRTRLDLLPFYSRMVAILSPVMPEVPQDLASLLKSDFKYHFRKKDQINIESKIKVIRYIGELVKFNLYSKIEGLYCLKVLLHDFTHHHIEMACNYLESCGRYFFRNPDTHQRTKVYLEQMMRKKAVMPLDYRYVTMIENAFYHVNPPETTITKIKVRPMVHEFIRKLLYQDLVSSETDEQVLILLRKLDWDNAETSAYAIKCLTSAYNVKYFHIKTLANLLAGLVNYQEFVGAHVVDGVLEDIRIGMELNLPKLNQRRIAMVKYLGELYNYRMLESNDVFKILYSLISFGVTLDYDYPSPFDPPGNLFRIRLVCVLLETCGQYFSHGLSKTKLDYFLTYFQNYVQYKFCDPYWTTSEVAFPVHMNFIYRDIVLSLRPNIKLCSSYEESKAIIDELQVKFMAIIGQPIQDHGDQGLTPIVERGAVGGEEGKEDEAVGGTEIIPNDWEDIYSDEEFYDDFGDCASPDVLKGSSDTRTTRLVDRERSISTKTDSYRDWVDYEVFDSDECSDNRGESPLSQEDEEFQTAFDRMVFDNIQERMKENIKHQQVDISVPLSIKTSSKKTYEQLLEPEQKDSNVNFTLMIRKGNKQQYKNLSVPTDSELAINLRSQEEAERMEKERVKRLTLDINDRLEEEDYQDQLAQLANTNHQKKIVKGIRQKPSQDKIKSIEDRKVSTNTTKKYKNWGRK